MAMISRVRDLSSAADAVCAAQVAQGLHAATGVAAVSRLAGGAG